MSEFEKVDATTVYTQELTNKLRSLYPLLEEGNQKLFNDWSVSGGSFPFVSFAPLKLKPLFRAEVLMKAIDKVEDNDPIMVGGHGEAHVVYHEVLQRIKESLGQFTARFIVESSRGFIDENNVKHEAPIKRLLVETPGLRRIVYRPNPFVEAQRNLSKQNHGC